MRQFGDPVTLTTVEGKKITSLVIGVRTEPATHIGTNGEPLLSVAYFTPGPTFGTADSVIVHDVPHSSVEGIVGVGRWDDYQMEAEPGKVETEEAHPEGWKQQSA
jgi:hypothetical protein